MGVSEMQSSICVVGGSGFLGTSIAKLLESAQRPFSIVDIRPSAAFPERFVEGDVTSLGSLRQSVKGDCIIHLAAVHRDDVRPVSLYDDVNVQGAANLCKVAEESHINKIIFASSVAVYGFVKNQTDEHGEISYFNDYGRTKWGAEEVLREWQAKSPEVRSLVIIRPTVIFGPGNRGNVFNLLKQIASGKFLMIGPGQNTKSMAYVENVAAFFVHATGQDHGVHVFNYVDGPDFSMNDLVILVRQELTGNSTVGPRLPLWGGLLLGRIADVVARVSQRRLPLSYIRVKKFVSTTSFVSNRVSSTGFVAPFSLAEGLRRTIDAEFLHPLEGQTVFYTE